MNKPKVNQETLLFLMRITLFHIILTSFSIAFANAVDTMGQELLNRKVTIDIESEEFHEALLLISEQTKVKFAYSPELIEGQKKVTLHLKEAKLADVLNSLLGSEINYKVVGKRIVLRPVVQPSEEVEELRAFVPSAISISGTVSDANGAAMPGVSIVVRGTNVGTTTDTDGKFALSVSGEDDILVFSFIGYATQEVVVGNRTVIDVTLVEDATQLSEVVVTALGIPRETKTLVYATQQVKPAQLTEVRDANNVLNSLQGKIANAVITQGSGGPGSGARIVLRGNRSIQGTNNALIVVDGVPITNGTNGTITSDFGGLQGIDGASSINPDDIESMTILRGASAAALYGSQAGNGVIVITTKKGVKDRISVTVNSGVVSEKVFVLPDFQNTYGQGNSGLLNGNSGESWGAKMDGQSFTAYNGEQRSYSSQEDNVKDFFRTGVSWNNSIGISGGSEKMQTYLSYANNNVKGILPRNDLNRHTFNLRLSNQISRKFSADAKITYVVQDIDSRYETGESALSPPTSIYQIPRNVSLDDAKNFATTNSLGSIIQAPYPVINPALYQNPYWIVNRTETNESRDRIMGFISLKYNITDWLHISGRANLDKVNDFQERIFSDKTIGLTALGGAYRTTRIDVTQKWFDAILEGSNKITDDLKIDYRVGGILQDNLTERVYNNANGLNVTNVFSLVFATNPNFQPPTNTPTSVQIQTQSVYGQINLAFKESLFLDASLRTEWDSRLPAPYRFSYPSVGLSAIVSDLASLPEAISFLKLSGNYAEVGNGGIAQARNNTFLFAQGAGHGFIYRDPTKAIPDLKPEIVKNLEFGIDAKFLDDRLGFQFTVYKSNSINQLLKVSVPVGTGFFSQYINAGDIQNKGLELVLNATPIKSALTWDVAFNLGMNRNKVVKLTETVKQFLVVDSGFGRSATPVIREGESFGDMLGYFWMNTADVYDDDGELVSHSSDGTPLVTSAGKPLSSLTTGDQAIIGNFNPKATLGLTNVFTYKSLSARLLIDGRIGGTIMDGTEQLIAYNGATEATAHFREGGWNLGGVDSEGNPVDATINAQDFWTTASGGRYGSAEFFLYDATNFRVREFSLGYNIPLPSLFPIKSARLSLVARNLFFLYRGSSKLSIPGIGKRKMSFDPDMSLGNGNWQGISYGALPSTRSIGLNLQLTF
jgi:TonB-linked SusC/RagA family outer membrane protein